VTRAVIARRPKADAAIPEYGETATAFSLAVTE
jgi:hypothetical protein